MPDLQVKESWNQVSPDWVDNNPFAVLAEKFQVSEGALMIRLKEIKGLNKIRQNQSQKKNDLNLFL